MATNEDRVFSRILGCHIVAVGSGSALRLRLGTGARGDELVPIYGESALFEWEERRLAGTQRAERERKRFERELERAARIAAEARERSARVAALARERIARLAAKSRERAARNGAGRVEA